MKRLLLLFIAFAIVDCRAQKNTEKRVEEMRRQYIAHEYEKAYQSAKKVLLDDNGNLSALNCLMNTAYELKHTKECFCQ